MEHSQSFIKAELINSIVNANQKMVNNYLKNYSGYNHDIRDISLTYYNFFSKILVQPKELVRIFNYNLDYIKIFQNIWEQVINNENSEDIKSFIEPQKGDKRFLDSEWTTNSYFDFLKQSYLSVSNLIQKIVDDVEMDEKLRKKLDFYTMQYVNALSPSNFLFTNPNVLKLALETNGKSICDGLKNLAIDLENGRIKQVDENAYKVGVDLATTHGAIIYENDLMQLIQYSPSTKNVFELPIVIIPPWINKFYILDLKENNSFVKYLIEKGITVFMISWRNPKSGMGSLSFDDYVRNGAIKAIEVAKNITKSEKVNMLGYCLGGTLLSVTCSILSSNQKENPINSATFLASMVDFSDIGPMGDVIDGALISKLERGELLHDGLLSGHDMETAFNLIRPNDLIWNYFINNYLKGLQPNNVDVIYWTNDNTNLPAEMYIYYMKQMILENKLSRQNALKICNTPIDIGKIIFPVIVIGLKEDNISPAQTVFTTTELVNGPVEFILGESGHVMGVVNSPTKNKYGYYLNGQLGAGYEKWKETSTYFQGSWWPIFLERLIKLSGNEIPASINVGNDIFKSIESAPGRFVLEKC